MQLGQEIEELVAQILTAEDGTSWRCDYEPPAVGVRGLVVFTSEDGESASILHLRQPRG